MRAMPAMREWRVASELSPSILVLYS